MHGAFSVGERSIGNHGEDDVGVNPFAGVPVDQAEGIAISFKNMIVPDDTGNTPGGSAGYIPGGIIDAVLEVAVPVR